MTKRAWLALGLVWLSAGVVLGQGQTTAFTYQGQLTNAAQPANGNFDVQFGLFDGASGGTQIGTTQTVSAVPVSGGVFTVQLDFGVSAFPGANRFLEISVRPAGAGSYTTLAPRQQISSTPYAIRTLSAATADALSSACVGCVQDTQIQSVAGSKVSGTIPAAGVPSGSGNYVQNTTTPQANANFNIAGNGVVGGNLTVAGTLNANIGGNFIQNGTTPQTASFNISGNGVVGGNLGVGTASPVTKLEVDGGSGDAVYGVSTSDRGVVGSSQGQAGVVGVSNSFDGVFGQSHDTNNAGVFGTNDSTGGFGVDGVSIGGPGTQGNSTTGPGVAGVSTGGPGVVGTSTNGSGVYGQSAANLTQPSAAGVYGNATGNSGIGVIGESDGNNAVGVFGVSASANGFGVYGRENAGGFAMEAEGNVQQSRDKGGWVKAMVAVNEDGTIARCYNGQLNLSNAACGSVTTCCGITVDHPLLGDYVIDCGFVVSDRFWSITMGRDDAGVNDGAYVTPYIPGSTVLYVSTFYANQQHGLTNEPFVFIVY